MKRASNLEHTSEILLLNPPFGPIEPYISIPVLASYLRKHGFRVSAYDIKRELYIQLLTSQNIFRGIRYANKRFIELNSQPKLTFSEIFEFSILVLILSEKQKFRRAIKTLLSPFADFTNIQNSNAIDFFIRTATSPFFPEIILPNAAFSVGSVYNIYSSTDILTASENSHWYTLVIENIIEENILPVCSPTLIGFSVVFPSQIIPAFQCARIIKKFLPDVHITMGGPCISTYFRVVQAKQLFHIVDSFVLDEGEIPLETLAQELSKSKPELSNVPGLIYLADDHIHVNPPASSINIEQSPYPDYTVFQLDNYLLPRDKLTIPLRFSKGCRWQKCTFCRTGLRLCYDYQQSSMEQAYLQLIHVVENSGMSSFLFSDESSEPEVLEYISKRLIEDRIHIQWYAHTRVSKKLTKERCELYLQAGCTGLRLGIESFSDRILKLMKKGITVQQISNVLYEIDGVLPLLAYMLIGFPSETEEEALNGHEKLQSFIAKGLLKKYLYTPFFIASGCDIWKNLERYQIFEFSVPDGSDLSPDIIHFESPGLSPEKAYQLAEMFNQPASDAWSIDEVLIDNKTISLKYDCQKISRFLLKKNFTNLPFIQYLHHYDELCDETLSANNHYG
jgi:radical SAM superfamily enzyme YgiQ (UPF0313 family)